MNDTADEPLAWLARTYRLDPEIVALIDGMAAAYGAPQSHIVNILLTIGLEELDSGRRYLNRTPIRYSVELAPERSDG